MIIAAMATMPDRLPYLEGAVTALRPQVDELRVYLNDFTEVPDFLTAEEGRLSSDAAGDLGDAGKFYWFDGREGTDHTHYLTVDDDLGYPEDYVARMVDEFDTRGKQAVVGVHGSTFSQPIENFITSRQNRYRFYEPLDTAKYVHILGTATTILCQSTIDISLDTFALRNAADLQLAIAAQNQRVPMIAVPRPAEWITEERAWTEKGYSIWKATKEASINLPQTVLAQTAIGYWDLYDVDEDVERTLDVV